MDSNNNNTTYVTTEGIIVNNTTQTTTLLENLTTDLISLNNTTETIVTTTATTYITTTNTRKPNIVTTEKVVSNGLSDTTTEAMGLGEDLVANNLSFLIPFLNMIIITALASVGLFIFFTVCLIGFASFIILYYPQFLMPPKKLITKEALDNLTVKNK